MQQVYGIRDPCDWRSWVVIKQKPTIDGMELCRIVLIIIQFQVKLSGLQINERKGGLTILALEVVQFKRWHETGLHDEVVRMQLFSSASSLMLPKDCERNGRRIWQKGKKGWDM